MFWIFRDLQFEIVETEMMADDLMDDNLANKFDRIEDVDNLSDHQRDVLIYCTRSDANSTFLMRQRGNVPAEIAKMR